METQQLVDHIARTPLSQILMFAAALSVFRVATFKYVQSTPIHRRGETLWKAFHGIGELFDALIYAAIFIFMVIRPFAFQTFQIPTGSLVPTCMVGDFIGLNKAVYRYSEPKRGDIVVFRPPVEACERKDIEDDGKTVKVDFVKRLIGLPGDTIEIRQGVVSVNGKPLWEPYRQYTAEIDSTHTKFKILEGVERDAITKPNWKLVRYKNELIPLNYTEFDANRFGGPYSVAQRFRIEDPTEWPKARALPAEKIPEGYYMFMGDNRNGSFDSRGWGLVPKASIVGRAEFIWLPLPRIGKITYVDNGEKPAPNAEIEEFLQSKVPK